MAPNLNDLAQPSRRNWSIFSLQDHNRLYVLSLTTLTGKTRLRQILNAELAAGLAVDEFVFPMHPKSINQEEPPAVTIQPTQDRGKFIEHQGQIFKDIHIAGTTGLRPNKGGSPIPVLGSLFDLRNPLVLTDFDTGLPAGERTGFDDLISLRNMFRTYYALKEDLNVAHEVVMVWQNGKEGDFYIVEPTPPGLRTSRDAGSPLTISYEFGLKTIERWEGSIDTQPIDTIKELRNKSARGFQRLTDAIKSLANSARTLQQLEGRLSSIGVASFSTVTKPINDLLINLSGAITGAGRFVPATSAAIDKEIQDVQASARILSEAIDNIGENPYKTDAVISQAAQGYNACLKILRDTSRIASVKEVFLPSLSETAARKVRAYNDAITGAPKSSNGSFIGNIRSGAGVGEATVNGGDTIKTVTQRLLGRAERWKEIVLLNGLRQPYISVTGDGITVLRPGDPILYPLNSSDTANSVGVAKGTKVRNATYLDDRLGIDIRLKSDAALGAIVVKDFATKDGDIDVITGIDNLSQAIDNKFQTEKGELKPHPEYGALFSVGAKIRQTSLIQFNFDVRATVLSDSRIRSIKSLKTAATGNQLTVNATLLVKGTDEALPTRFEIAGQRSN